MNLYQLLCKKNYTTCVKFYTSCVIFLTQQLVGSYFSQGCVNFLNSVRRKSKVLLSYTTTSRGNTFYICIVCFAQKPHFCLRITLQNEPFIHLFFQPAYLQSWALLASPCIWLLDTRSCMIDRNRDGWTPISDLSSLLSYTLDRYTAICIYQ